MAPVMVRCVVVAVLSLFGADLSGGELRIVLHEEVTLARPQATLAAVAALGGDEDLIARAGPVVVQRLDGRGIWHIDAARVRAALAQVLPRVSPVIQGRCAVERRMRRFTAAELAAVARADLTARLPERAEVRIRLRRQPRPLVVPADETQPAELACNALTDNVWGEVPYRIRVLRGEREVHRGLVVLQVAAMAEVPVATRELAPDSVLSLADLRPQRRKLSDATGARPPTLEDLVGRRLRRRIQAGDPVPLKATRAPLAVRVRQPVTLLFRSERFVLTGPGVALADAPVDQLVRVRQSNGRIVTGRALAGGRVLVNYQQ